jgi:hypothetical protein
MKIKHKDWCYTKGDKTGRCDCGEAELAALREEVARLRAALERVKALSTDKEIMRIARAGLAEKGTVTDV